MHCMRQCVFTNVFIKIIIINCKCISNFFIFILIKVNCVYASYTKNRHKSGCNDLSPNFFIANQFGFSKSLKLPYGRRYTSKS